MKNLKYTDKPLLFTSVLLFLIGLVMIFSSSNIAAFMRYNSEPYYFLLRQSFLLLGGLVIFLTIIKFDTKFYSMMSWIAVLVSIGLLAILFTYGTIANKAKSWIYISWFGFQPSEVAKVALIVWYAAFFELKRNKLDKISTCITPLLVSAIISVMVMLQPDFGTAGVIMILSFLLYLLIPIPVKRKLSIALISFFIIAFGLLIYYVISPSSFSRQISRLSFWNPCSEEKFYTTGNQVCNSYIAFNNGSLSGKGLGNSTQKYLYLPESHTDFIFAIVVEETGFVGAISIIILYMFLLARIIIIGNQSTSSRGSIICYGVAIYIFLHITINLLGIMGWLPLTGIPLPFLSYGGTFTLCLIFTLSLVQRIAVENKLRKIEEQKRLEKVRKA